MRSSALAVIAVLLGGCPKASKPTKQPDPAADPDDEIVEHTWSVEDHLRVKGASIAEADANGFVGRTIVVLHEGFASPWQPTCNHAKREKRTREMSELFAEIEIADGGATKAAAFGMTSDILEFRLTCTERDTPLIIWVGGKKAMSCFSGACYLMKRFED